MDAKLTLKLDKEVIEKAKRYAASQNRSLSGIVESYLQSISLEEPETKYAEIEITPFVKSMSSGIHIPADLDYKKEYADYLDKKYK